MEFFFLINGSGICVLCDFVMWDPVSYGQTDRLQTDQADSAVQTAGRPTAKQTYSYPRNLSSATGGGADRSDQTDQSDQ